MTDQNIIIKNRSTSIVWIGIIFLLLAVIIWQFKCGASRGIDPKVAQLKEQKSADSAKYVADKKAWEDSLKSVNEQRQFEQDRVKEKERNIVDMEKEIDRLLSNQKNLPKPVPIDSGKFAVSAQWIAECANCYGTLEKYKDSTKSLRSEQNNLNHTIESQGKLYQRRIFTLDSTINEKDKNYTTLLNKYAKANESKVSIAIGIEAMYSPVVSNFGGWITLKDKRGKIYGIDYGINTLQKQYFGIRAGFTLLGNR